jgi:ubiquinone/menaquinone biosynthesis C-methylase UbiE
MSLYSKYVLPRIVDYTCRARPTMRQRRKIVPRASGKVLEIGIGSGLNLPFYDPSLVAKVWGLEPSPEMISMASAAAAQAPFEVEFIEAGCESIPLGNGSVDTILLTYTLCTIPESEPALREIARVLKPGGRLLFCEHGVAPDAGVRRVQNLVNPVWRRLGGGCHLNRDIVGLIQMAGFEVTGLESMYIPGWRPASFNYWGTAQVC